MLQQTQVATVLPYFERFVAALSRRRGRSPPPPLDDVLALWSGLGYYGRARNLHRGAQVIVAEHGGEFPRRSDGLRALPGIGRSTAAAIAAFCFGERVAILDGNVKRVLARVLAFAGDLAEAGAERELWSAATALLPAQRVEAYTQGLMDLGATVCLARAPRCLLCPVREVCAARAHAERRNAIRSSRAASRAAGATTPGSSCAGATRSGWCERPAQRRLGGPVEPAGVRLDRALDRPRPRLARTGRAAAGVRPCADPSRLAPAAGALDVAGARPRPARRGVDRALARGPLVRARRRPRARPAGAPAQAARGRLSRRAAPTAQCGVCRIPHQRVDDVEPRRAGRGSSAAAWRRAAAAGSRTSGSPPSRRCRSDAAGGTAPRLARTASRPHRPGS